MSKPQRRTLVKALRNLVDRVNGDIFSVISEKEVMDNYKPLLRAVNAAEIILDRERQHEIATARKDSDND